MIERYSLDQMKCFWTEEARWNAVLKVEVALAKAQAEEGIIPKKAAKEIASKASFKLKRIKQIEKKTKHDVIAFVSTLAESVGDSGKYIHYGLTSSDALDTATSVQILQAKEELDKKIKDLDKAFKKNILQHKATLCTGRTHGIHAEPTTFGYKMAGYYQEFLRNKERLNTALKQCLIAKLSGAVGTYSAQSEKVEKIVAKSLGLKPEVIATQVIPRDRHAELILSISLFAAGLDRLALELRHLQRTEVSEVIEGFSKGQKGSSAMPHKKNPISAENISGLCRVLKSYSHIALENVSLWHERDISHSSAERIILGDAFILLHYLFNRMTNLLNNLYVDKDRMLKNMDLSQGNLFSSHILLALIEKGGWSRERAYKKVQSLAHSLKSSDHLKEAIKKDPEVISVLSKKQIADIFSGKRHIANIQKRLTKLLSK